MDPTEILAELIRALGAKDRLKAATQASTLGGYLGAGGQFPNLTHHHVLAAWKEILDHEMARGGVVRLDDVLDDLHKERGLGP